MLVCMMYGRLICYCKYDPTTGTLSFIVIMSTTLYVQYYYLSYLFPECTICVCTCMRCTLCIQFCDFFKYIY